MEIRWKDGTVTTGENLWGATYAEPVAVVWAHFKPGEDDEGQRVFTEHRRTLKSLTHAEAKAVRWALIALHEGRDVTQGEAP